MRNLSGWDARVSLQSATHGPPHTSHLHCLEDPNVVAVAAGSVVVPPSLVLVSFRQWLGVLFGRLAWCGLAGRNLAVLERVGSGVVLFGARLLSDVLGVVHNLGTSLCLSL